MNYPKWKPDETVATLTQKPVVVQSLKDYDIMLQEDRLKYGTPLQIDYTDLDDIDDTMDMETALIGLITPDLPNREYNIRTLTNESLVELKNNTTNTNWIPKAPK